MEITSTAAVRAENFIDTIDVNTHISWPDAGLNCDSHGNIYNAMSDRADYGSWHTNFGDGDQPSGSLDRGVEGAKMLVPNDPVVLTESGYRTAANDVGWIGGGAPEDIQARLALSPARSREVTTTGAVSDAGSFIRVPRRRLHVVIKAAA
jgi:hypothetical protein